MSVSRPANLINFGCLNPLKITKKDGSSITVPCRCCSYCRLHSSFIVSQLGSLEASECNHILFVTLTYNNQSIPKLNFQWHNPDLFSSEINDDTIFNLQLFDENTGEIVDDLCCKKNTIDYAEKVSRLYVSRFPKYFKNSQIPVIKQSHIRDFIKRVNSRCFRKFKQRSLFRYLYCSEYGPRTYRPHYHILFFCKSEAVRHFIYQSLYPSLFSKSRSPWLFGRVNAKYYSGHGCEYLTSYCQGFNAISAITSRSSVRSRCRHSQKLGFGALFKKFRILDFPSNYVQYHFEIDGKAKILCPSSGFENTFYPRCRNFGFLPLTEQYKYYTFADYYIKRFKEFGLNSPTLLCNHIIQEIKEFRDYYGIIDLDKHSDTSNIPDFPYYLKIFGCDLLQCDLNKLRNIIYYDCSISFKFLKSFNFFNSNNKILSSFASLVRLINRYYKSKNDFYHEKDKRSISILENLGDETALQYFEDNREISDDYTDYRSSPSFLCWKNYINLCFEDSSKMKKIKDPFTNKSYI